MALTFIELQFGSMADRWRSLSADQQEAIGALILLDVFATLVREDDGVSTSVAERIEAGRIADDAFGMLYETVEACFPEVCWRYPDGTVYEVHSRRSLIGHIVTPDAGGLQFQPVNVAADWGRIFKSPQSSVPEALPRWARRLVNMGGSIRAVPPASRMQP